MGFQDNIPGIHTRAFNQVAVSATYTSTELDMVECRVRVKHDVMLPPSDFDARVVELGTVIKALYSEVGMPEKSSTFVVNGTTYTVQRIIPDETPGLGKVFTNMAVIEEATL